MLVMGSMAIALVETSLSATALKIQLKDLDEPSRTDKGI
jgi:hypothetical protein